MKQLTIEQIMSDQNIYRSYYCYTLSTASLSAQTTSSNTVNIENDSQFIWTKTSYFVDEAGAPQNENTRIIPLVNIQITDSGSARQFFDEPQPINSIAGQGNIPFILPAPFIFRNNSNINASFNNYSAATTYDNITVTLHGFRIYTTGLTVN